MSHSKAVVVPGLSVAVCMEEGGLELALGGWRRKERTSQAGRSIGKGLRCVGGGRCISGRCELGILEMTSCVPGGQTCYPIFPSIPCLLPTSLPLPWLGYGQGLALDSSSFGDKGPLLGLLKVLVGFSLGLSRDTPLSRPRPSLAHPSLLCLPCSHHPFWSLLCSVHFHLPLA